MAENRNVFCGVDIGSTTSKAVLIDGAGEILTFAITDTLQDRNESGEIAFQMALQQSGIAEEEIVRTYSTGYGRHNYERAYDAIPEIVCHAVGTNHHIPGVRTIIDIGGQDAKLISLDGHGNVLKFEMNDKCAAGTGRFFEVLSNRLLHVNIDELGPMAMRSTEPCQISSTCTVFAETEIVSYLSQGKTQENIAMGILESVSKRIYAMGRGQIPFDEPIAISGGPAKNEGLKAAFEKRIGKPVIRSEHPQMEAALGAAVMARDDYYEENH